MNLMPKLFRLLPKTIVIAFALLIISVGIAQAAWYEPTAQEYQEAIDECEAGEVGLECTVTAIVNNVIQAGGYGIGNEVSQRPGALFYASALIGTLVGNPPVSSEEYVHYVASRLNLAQPAYAQGTGYSALSPLIPIWAAFRNIAYLAFVVIFLFIGFMIMFRARLDPQTVVNVQNSLPKLIITLLLITFSYAIAGFMVDIIYLGIYLIVSTLASQGLIQQPLEVRSRMVEQNIFQVIFTSGIWRVTSTAGNAVQDLINTALDNPNVPGQPLLGSIFNGIARLILLVALLFACFKLFFQLLLTYVEIILATIFAPIMILFNALPGSNSFGNWLRNFLANILIFPAVAALFLIGAILVGPCQNCPATQTNWGVTRSLFQSPGEPGWLPPFVGFQQGVDVESVLALIGFGIILFAPNMVSVLKQALKAKPMPVSGVFAPIAAGAGVVGGVLGAPARAIRGVGERYIGGYIAQKGEFAAGAYGERGTRRPS